MRTTTFTGTALALLLGATACDGGGGGLPLEELPESTADAICDQVIPCLGIFADVLGTDTTCHEQTTAGTRNGPFALWEAAIARGTAVYDGEAAEACIAATSAVGCEVVGRPPPAACADVFRGALTLGEVCSNDIECAGPAYCAGAACPDTSGICTMRVAGGGSCAAPNECTAGMACEGGTCVVPTSSSGGSCNGPGDCPLDEYCAGAMGGSAGTCLDRASLEVASLGDTCNLLGVDVVLCRDGVSCAITGIVPPAGAEFECVADVASGATCNAAVPSMCPSGEYCAGANPLMLMLEGTCTVRPAPGESCGSSLLGEVCAFGSNCVAGTCVTPQANGGACDSDAGCYSGRCRGGACVPPELCAI